MTTCENIEMKPLNNKTRPPIVINTHDICVHAPPPDCCPRTISDYFLKYQSCVPLCVQQRWTHLRARVHRLVEHRFFEWLIIASILASSTTLVSRSRSSMNE
jgi:hypothetical protein